MIPLPPPITPITVLERLWLDTSAAYAVLDETMMEDTLWDLLAVRLWERRLELTPYFAHAVGLPWPVPPGEPGENPLKTAMGINWEKHLPAIVLRELKSQGVPARMAYWGTRLKDPVR